MAESGKVSGRVVVIVLFAAALLMWAAVLMTGFREKRENRAAAEAAEAVDSASDPTRIRSWMNTLPETWVKVTRVEGQGYVLYVPCYSSNSSLVLRTRPDSLPGISCEYCDSLGRFDVTGISRPRRDSSWEFRLEPPAGSVRIFPVDEALLKRFPEAPFKDKVLLWIRTPEGGAADSMLFVPKSQETEFESLRAEDENPEGCGTEAE